MNREDIMRMAEASGVEDSLLYEHWRCNLESMTRFATLVASAEREAIAQMIEDAPVLMEFAQNDQGGCLMCGFTPKLAAKTTRARGQA